MAVKAGCSGAETLTILEASQHRESGDAPLRTQVCEIHMSRRVDSDYTALHRPNNVLDILVDNQYLLIELQCSSLLTAACAV